MNGEELIKYLADKLNAGGVPPTDSSIINMLLFLNETELKSIIDRNNK